MSLIVSSGILSLKLFAIILIVCAAIVLLNQRYRDDHAIVCLIMALLGIMFVKYWENEGNSTYQNPVQNTTEESTTTNEDITAPQEEFDASIQNTVDQTLEKQNQNN